VARKIPRFAAAALTACLAAGGATAQNATTEESAMAKKNDDPQPQPDRSAPPRVAVSASRASPKRAETIVIGPVRYEAVWGSLGRFRATDAKTGRELWALDLYKISYVPGLETDVQDVFIVQLERESDDSILATDERGRAYRVDLKKRASSIARWPVSLRDVGRPLSVEIVIGNGLERTLKLDRPSVAFGGRLQNDLFEVKADGKPVPYGGMMKKRAPPDSFLELRPRDEYRQVVDLSENYRIPPGTKSVEVRFRHHNHFSPDNCELESRPLKIDLAAAPAYIAAPRKPQPPR